MAIRFPHLKTTFAQGPLMAKYLRLLSRKTLHKTSAILRELHDIVIADAAARNIVQFDDDEARLKKTFDSEYSRVRDFSLAFELVDTQRDLIMLTFYGRKLLSHVTETKRNDLFDDANLPMLAQVFIDVDEHRWHVLEALSQLRGRASVADIVGELGQGRADFSLSADARARVRRNVRAANQERYWQEGDQLIKDALAEAEKEQG
jgi:hypothetical protein